jgi:hypothetical protein
MGTRGLTFVEIVVQNNTYWTDAFQFGLADDQTWNFNGMSFLLDLKLHRSDTTAVLSTSSAAGTIVVQDPINRILSMYVSDHAIRAALQPDTKYEFDLIMVNNTTGQRDALMYGTVKVDYGVTVED